MQFRPRTIIITLILLFAIIVGIVISIALTRVGKIAVSINVQPSDSTIFVDGKKSGSTAYVTPGTHTFTAHKSGFNDAISVIKISSSRTVVTLLPDPVSGNAIIWAHNTNQDTLQTMADAAANERGQSLQDRYPIIAKLPYVEIAGPFSIDYGYTGVNNTDVYLLIHDSTPDGRVNALDWLKSQGADLSSLDIRYDGEFTNPLTGKDQ